MPCPGLSAMAMMVVEMTAAVPAAQADPGQAFSAAFTGENIYEVKVTGTRFTSREAIEARLLLETARFTLSQRREWFRLLRLPSETVTARDGPVAGYPSWHSQWFYRLKGERWAPWRPHWGATFWAGDIDVAGLEAFEASALVELGLGAAENGQGVFDAENIVRDFRSGVQ